MSIEQDKENIKEYKSSSLLGSGTFANVYKMKKESNEKSIVVKKYYTCEEYKKNFSCELDIYKLVKGSKYIPMMYDFSEEEMKIYIEYLPMTLWEYHKSVIDKKKWDPLLFASYIKQTLLGLKDLHSKGIYHSDLTPSNLLVNREGDLKICDFSNSYVISSDGKVLCRSGKITQHNVCTIVYSSPEFIIKSCLSKNYKEEELKGIDSVINVDDVKSVDIWSLGIIILQILGMDIMKLYNLEEYGRLTLTNACMWFYSVSGSPSEEDLKNLTYLKQIKGFSSAINGVVRYACKELVMESSKSHLEKLLEGMLKLNPKERFTPEKALESEFFSIVKNIE